MSQCKPVKMRAVIIALLIIITSNFVSGNCPVDKSHVIGQCSYRIQCFNTIDDIKLESDCQGSSNHDVKVDVTLHNASDTFNIGTKPEVLAMITTLTVYGNWPKTELKFLRNMYTLRNLNIIGNNIELLINSPFHNLVNIENIDLSHNKIMDIEELFQFETRPFKIRKLSLAYNAIEEVLEGTFEDLRSLIELDLSYNFITELDEASFCNLTNLQVLQLNNNKIQYINGALNKLLNLRHLHLRFNNIDKIEMETIKTISHLETFDISKNKIENINPILLSRHWDHLSDHSTCRIILSENYITHVPNATIALVERYRTNNTGKSKADVHTKLDLSKNSITHVEYNAFNFIQLASIDLSNNKLTDFIVNPDDLMYVNYLNLSSNFLSRLYYETFSSMHNLQNLDLSHNFMDYFPDQTLSNTYNLKYVNVTFNDIPELHHLRITFHPGGGVLDLSNNGLSALTIPANEAAGLKELILNSNNISNAYLVRLSDQHDLLRLDMSNNIIEVLDDTSLQLPASVGYLDLSYNDIHHIKPSAFHRVNNLKTLRLSHNQLTYIEHGVFRGLSRLLNLDLSNNQIGQLDSKVFMDLKQLSVLSLGHNGLNILIHDNWLTHGQDLTVYIDGNNLSCEWLAKALTDYNRGYSKMRPTTLDSAIIGSSIQGIPCKQEAQNLENPTSKYLTDERLLIICQKILAALQEQTSFLKRYTWRSILEEAERKIELNRI